MDNTKDRLPITILMAVYNGEKYLVKSINSVLYQTFTDFEFIIIDDCSYDSSCKIIESYNDRRIKLIRNRINLGFSASLNIGIRASRGKYIARFDCDDICLPERIEIQYKFMEENSQIGILGTGYYKIDKNGKGKKVYIYPKDEIDVKWKLLLGPIFPHPTVMFRKDILINNNIYYNEAFSATQDYELWSRLIQYTEGTNLSLPLIEYRHHSESISKSDSVIQEKLRLKVSAQSLANLTKTRNISDRHAAVFEKVIKYQFDSLSLSELKQGWELFFHVLTKFYRRTYNAGISKLKWKSELLFNIYNHFEKFIRKNFIIEEAKINIPSIELFQLRIIQISLRFMCVILKPRQSIYYPFGIIVYSTQVIKRLSKFQSRLPIR